MMWKSQVTTKQTFLNQTNLINILIICGIIAPALWIVTDITAGLLYSGYDFNSQAISELFAIGAPVAWLVVPLFTIYDILALAFAWGIWQSAEESRLLRAIALLLSVNAVNGLVIWNVFPMHMRGEAPTFTDLMHIILAAVGPIFALAAIVLGAINWRNWFRVFSILVILALLGFAVISFSQAPRLAANLSTPWLGLAERLSTDVYLVWQAVFSIILLLRKQSVKSEIIS